MGAYDSEEERIPVDYDSISWTTDKAWLLDLGGGVQVWVPRSQCSLEVAGDGCPYFLIPEWLAKDKGLI
jgi:hypothetical protein